MPQVDQGAELLGWSPRPSDHPLENGKAATLYVQFSPEGAAVSDLGSTLESIGPMTPEVETAVRHVCRANDVQLEDGALLAKVPPGGDVGEAVDRLGRVCARINRTASEAASPGR